MAKRNNEIEIVEKLQKNGLSIDVLAKSDNLEQDILILELTDTQTTILTNMIESHKQFLLKNKNYTYTLLENVQIRGIGNFVAGKITKEQYLSIVSANVQLSKLVKIEDENA